MHRLLTYMRFIKLEHTVFSFPLLLGGAWLARPPSFREALWILLAGAGARTAALALNRIIDRDVDHRNPRTANRELPSGAMTLKEAWGITAVGTLVYHLAAWRIAPVCLWYAPLPLLVFVSYPFLKRWTPLAHLGVGVGLAMAPLGGWFAVAQRWQGSLPAFILALFTLCWVTGFDIIYATLDEESDRTRGLHSLPVRLGRTQALRIAAWLHGGAFIALATLGTLRFPGMGEVGGWHGLLASWGTFLLLGIGGALLWGEHRTVNNVDLAFFKINATVGFVVMGLVMVGR